LSDETTLSTAATLAPATTLPKLTLVLGGARSGKSAYAEKLIATALPPGGRAVYLATAEALDPEMAARIAAHRARRGPAWITREVPIELAGALGRESTPMRPVLVDCLTLWLANLLQAGRDPAQETTALTKALACAAGSIVVVSNEVGLGIVPDNPLARDFRDHAGRLHQAIAGLAERVVLIAAGLPLLLKNTVNSTP
jgi:adenosylcobinamide kinase/adenosylcobinamide-phosphate guanylyltransferase